MEDRYTNQAEQTPDKLTLIIPSTGDAVRLQEFILNVRERFQARILHMVGSWQETVITLQSPVPPENILKEIARFPEVKKAKEKSAKIGTTRLEGLSVILEARSKIDNKKLDQYVGVPILQ